MPSPPPLPILLHHGLLGRGELRLGPIKFKYFPGIDHAIISSGHPLFISTVHPTGSIETRARQLKEILLAHLKTLPDPHTRVLVIAHSMGGLDARYMIAHLAMHKHVAALLTICTPHRGTPFADWCVRNLGKKLRGLQLARFLELDINALPDLTTESCSRFNDQTPDHPDVKYFSVSAFHPRKLIPPWGLHAHKIVFDVEGDNDSLVSIPSATYGTHLATWKADHWQTINHHYLPSRKQDMSPHYLRAIEQVLQAI
jgi:triacylglycerol lipase